MFKHKLHASLIHLGLSILLVGLVIGSLLFLFFPPLFISVSDFKEIATLIISIDLVLGPLLTFVVFKPKKKTLKFDLSVIGAIQLSALAYGAFALYQVHPVYITFNVDRFTIISAKDAEPQKARIDEYKVSKLSAGKLAFAKMPDDIEKRNELLFSAIKGAEDLDQKEEYYEPVKDNISAIIAKGLDPRTLMSDKKAAEFLKKHNGKIKDYAFLPLNSLKKDALIVIDKETAEPVATIDTDPWKFVKK